MQSLSFELQKRSSPVDSDHTKSTLLIDGNMRLRRSCLTASLTCARW